LRREILAERMARENVEPFKRAVVAGNRRDLEALREKLDPEVEWHPTLEVLLGGEAVEIESSWVYLVQFRRGTATLIRGYLDPRKALEAAGLQV
jgi:hypothetical protein